MRDIKQPAGRSAQAVKSRPPREHWSHRLFPPERRPAAWRGERLRFTLFATTAFALLTALAFWGA